MNISFQINDKSYTANLDQPLDLSIPLRNGLENPNAYFAPPVEFIPDVIGDFVCSTALGSPVNSMNLRINPHGNGTHTECVGHIAKEIFTINDCLRRFHFLAKLATVYPTKMPDGDWVVLRKQLEELVQPGETEAFILRTLPNDDTKLTRTYSGTNPPYLHHEAVDWLVECGIQHLLLDLPSVDREEDGGKLLSHKAFWRYGHAADEIRKKSTITEMIFVENEIQDGVYLLNLQIASLELDASPSKPVIFRL